MVRELQTMAILLDVYLGVPVIYSTFMQYDELAHHFGPSSKPAFATSPHRCAHLRDLANGARCRRAWLRPGHSFRSWNDAGASYRVEYGESLGATVAAMLAEKALISHSDVSEYADVGAKVVDTVAQATPPTMLAVRRALGRLRDWVRSRYGLRGEFLRRSI